MAAYSIGGEDYEWRIRGSIRANGPQSAHKQAADTIMAIISRRGCHKSYWQADGQTAHFMASRRADSRHCRKQTGREQTLSQADGHTANIVASRRPDSKHCRKQTGRQQTSSQADGQTVTSIQQKLQRVFSTTVQSCIFSNVWSVFLLLLNFPAQCCVPVNLLLCCEPHIREVK